jgi:glycosyltransferase involved in cell wall biosynthesis
MRISITALHRYPASVGGPGGGRVFDLIVKGLAELGHEVCYYPKEGASVPLADGARLVDEPAWDAEICHFRRDDELIAEAAARGVPYLVTCQTDVKFWGLDRSEADDNWVFVSRSLAETYGKHGFVYRGIDPEEFLYSEAKEDDFRYVGALNLAIHKGLDTATTLAEELRFRLIVAGSSRDRDVTARVRDLCAAAGAEYVGEVYGSRKAVLFAGARGLLFPTRLNEAFGLVMVEALVSGTPIICSDKGACLEVVTPEVGFVCTRYEDYPAAIEQVGRTDPRACRRRALECFHYRTAAERYVQEYHRELAHLPR